MWHEVIVERVYSLEPAIAEHGHEFFKVADVSGWQEYNFPELPKYIAKLATA